MRIVSALALVVLTTGCSTSTAGPTPPPSKPAESFPSGFDRPLQLTPTRTRRPDDDLAWQLRSATDKGIRHISRHRPSHKLLHRLRGTVNLSDITDQASQVKNYLLFIDPRPSKHSFTTWWISEAGPAGTVETAAHQHQSLHWPGTDQHTTQTAVDGWPATVTTHRYTNDHDTTIHAALILVRLGKDAAYTYLETDQLDRYHDEVNRLITSGIRFPTQPT